ncbi:MAG: hypothetical protein VW362_11905 [Candidatus Nanopelagicales bacterium]
MGGYYSARQIFRESVASKRARGYRFRDHAGRHAVWLADAIAREIGDTASAQEVARWAAVQAQVAECHKWCGWLGQQMHEIRGRLIGRGLSPEDAEGAYMEMYALLKFECDNEWEMMIEWDEDRWFQSFLAIPWLFGSAPTNGLRGDPFDDVMARTITSVTVVERGDDF